MKNVLCTSVKTVSAACLAIAIAACTQKPATLYMAGDSTMANKMLFRNVVDSASGDTIREPFPERGWGQMMPELVNENLRVKNFARNGRSTTTFISEGLWQKISDSIAAGDFVVMQFGHNDQKEGKKVYASPADYRANLLRFINEARAKGATPILCTSVVRRQFDDSARVVNSLGVYPDVVRELAATENVALVDMFKLSEQVLNELGVDSSRTLFLQLPAGVNRNFPRGVEDNTHFNERGAKLMATRFTEEVKRQHLALAKYLK